MTAGTRLTEEELYDGYLDAALRGEIEDPDAFLAARGAAVAVPAAAALRERLAAIHAMFREGGGSPPAGARRDATPGSRSRAGEGPRSPATAALAPEEGLPFASLGEYRLLRRLGGGGMGVVYLAEQTSLERLVALKTIRPEFLGSETAVRRFEREALALAQIRHPHVVAVHGFGEEQGVRFIAMEFIAGRSLSDVLAEAAAEARPLEPTAAVRWAAQIAAALHCAHEAGIVHRDVKPSNVRIAQDGRAVLVDFGLARDVEGGAATLTETFAGSPAYASPEQVAGSRELDGRADVYSLGVTLYQCLTGRAPFEAPTMEAVFRRVLHEEPPPPRRVNAAISADLETVVLKALEKDLSRRYASAAAFRADLEALLAFRPISARRPGRAERLLRWSRRRPRAAAAAATGALAVLALLALVVGQRVLDARERRLEARRSVAEAGAMLQTWREARAAIADDEAEVARLRRLVEFEYQPPDALARFEAVEEAVDASRLRGERAFYAALDRLAEAQRLDPDVPGVDAALAQLYVEKLNEANAMQDRPAAAFYEQQAAAHDPDGRVRGELLRKGLLQVERLPPGAEVHVFRLHEQSAVVPGGQHRFVPVPLDGPDPLLPPGTFCLRPLRAAPPLEPDDLVVRVAGHAIEGVVLVANDVLADGAGKGVGAGSADDTRVRRFDRLVAVDGEPVLGDWEVDRLREAAPAGDAPRRFLFERIGADGAPRRFETAAASLAELGVELLEPDALAERGGAPATVYRGGRLLELVLPPGLLVRTTATPAPLSPRTRIEAGPARPVELDPAGYLVVVRAPGRETLRAVAIVAPGAAAGVSGPLLRAGTTPPGWVSLRTPAGTRWRPIWAQDREVTAEEYLVFLNEPATLEEIDASPAPIRYPRQGGDRAVEPEWDRLPDGSFRISDDWDPRWPVVGVSWHDAVAYAAWRTARARADGLAHTYRLPTKTEFGAMASVGGFDWSYSYGLRFRPQWSNTCFSKPTANLEPVLRYPIDESPSGIYDLCGGAFEWLDAWYDEGRGMRHAVGGAWGRSDAVTNRVYGGLGFEPRLSTGETGFRLVLEIDGLDPTAER